MTKQSLFQAKIASLRCSETKSSTHTRHSWQPVIPGEQRETRNPGAKDWIPAYAGMTDGEAPSVSAHLLSAQHSGGLAMTREPKFADTLLGD